MPDAAVAGAASLQPRIAALSDRIEAERRLPDELVGAFADLGLFRLCVPRDLGGVEASPRVLVETIESIARADGAAGWCVMIGATTGVVSAYLDEAPARTIYAGDPLAVTGGVFAPRGRAVVDGDGYRVSGRWPFASGCQHCDWLMGGCIVFAGDEPQLQANGAPEPVMMLFPAATATIHDTWNVAGLCGTGSHDIEVRDLFVPRDYAVALVSGTPRATGTLYQFPVFGLLALGIAAVALGIARAAMDEIVALAQRKQPGGSRRSLAERSATQSDFARAEAQWRAARAFLLGTIDDTWAELRAGATMTHQRRALLRLAASHATDAAAAVVDSMYRLGGGTAIYAASRLQRCFRDVHVATQHMMVAPATYELSGRFLLGLDADASQL